MPAGATAAGQAAHRSRIKSRILEIAAAGGPVPSTVAGAPGLGWYAAQLEPRTFAEVADEIEYVGELEGLVASASSTANGGMTVQLQVLPAYVHSALDMVQRSTQGVLVCVLFQAPWDLFRPDAPDDATWPQLSDDAADIDDPAGVDA